MRVWLFLNIDFFGEAPDAARRSHSGIYDAKVLGPEGQRIQVILLDTCYNKGAFIKGAMFSAQANRRHSSPLKCLLKQTQ
jgi:alkaline phosphatase D